MDDGPWQCYLKFRARKISPQKIRAGENWLAFHHHMVRRIEVTIQYLTILVEPSKRSKESKILRWFRVVLVRPLEMWQEVNGSCSLELNSQEIKKFDQFLPGRRHPEFSETFPSVLLSPKNCHLPQPTKKQNLSGLIPIRTKPEVDAVSKADQHRWCESGFFSARPHWGKGSAAKGGPLADECKVSEMRFFFVFLERFSVVEYSWILIVYHVHLEPGGKFFCFNVLLNWCKYLRVYYWHFIYRIDKVQPYRDLRRFVEGFCCHLRVTWGR